MEKSKKKAPKVYKVKDPEPSIRFDDIHENYAPPKCIKTDSIS